MSADRTALSTRVGTRVESNVVASSRRGPCFAIHRDSSARIPISARVNVLGARNADEQSFGGGTMFTTKKHPWVSASVFAIAAGLAYAPSQALATISGQAASNTDTTVTYTYGWTG